MTDITVAIDKLDKIGLEKVKGELSQRNLNKDQVAIIEKYLSISGNNEEKLKQVKSLLGNNNHGKKGIEEIEFILNFGERNGAAEKELPINIDFTLARGLNYYTGIILEIKSTKAQMGSIGGGGRYDDLTGLFGVPNIPGVGISFGVDRIYDVMEELKLFPKEVAAGTQILLFNLGEEESKVAYGLMQNLRNIGIRCEIYPDFDIKKDQEKNSDKQYKYATKRNIPYIIIIGKEELNSETCKVKNLQTGEQQIIQQSTITEYNFQK